MPVKYISGDIFDTDAQTIAHGCNCSGRMGAGIALEMKRRYPVMFKEYRRRCYKGEFVPGSHYLFKDSNPWILNLATQGPTEGAKLEYIEACFVDFSRYYETEGVRSLALPKIGAGLGGLEWEEVRHLINKILHPLPIDITVHEL